MKQPTQGSNRSRKRERRGFVSLEKSCRKHRRAERRLLIACTINGKSVKPGDKVQVTNKKTHTGGGSIQFH